MKFSKFPIVRENGEQYLVKVRYTWSFGYEVLFVELYKKEYLKFYLFKISKSHFRFQCKFYKNDEYYYDITNSVKKSFEMYDEYLLGVKLKDEYDKLDYDNKNESIKKFEEWDGKL